MRHLKMLFIAMLISTMYMSVPSGPGTELAHANTCGNDGNHWYGRATSGSGSTNAGTELTSTTPASWSVASGSTTDEAAWIYSTNQPSSAVETGYYSGQWPYGSGGFTNSLVPYDTTGNGYYGWNWPNNPIPASTSLQLTNFGDTTGSNGYIFWGSTGSQAFSNPQTLPAPRTNMGQGEVVANTATWMGGGAGENFTGYWTDNQNWYGWSGHNDCNNSPYWVNSGGASLYANGGY